MLDTETKRRIDSARDILVGKVPDPKSQVEQITIALIYKFMDDMDREAEELGGERTFFSGEFEKLAWNKIFDPKIGGHELLSLYGEALLKLNINPNIPQLFRDIFKNAYLPYRDPETLKAFLKIIDEFTYDHSEKLGDAFEYLLSVLGSQGSAGQFRTPRHIIDFMVEIIAPAKNETVLDPACGTAGFLISSFKHILKHNSSNFDPETDKTLSELKVESLSELTLNSKKYKGDKLTPDERAQLAGNISGYDISPDMIRLSLVNMYLHGLNNPDISEYDTLTSEDNWNRFADVILANPPFMSPKGGIRPHNRFTVKSNRSEVLFVDYMAEHLTPKGRAAIIVPEGIIFQSGTAYKQLRKMLVDDYLVGVISLPAGVFNPYSGVKTSIIWLDKALARKTNNILFVKIAADGFDLGAQRRPIKENSLPEALKHIREYKQTLQKGNEFDVEAIPNFTLVDKQKIAANGDYNLSGERYNVTQVFNSNYVFKKIKDVARVESGFGFPLEKQGQINKPIPFYKVSDMNLSGNEVFMYLQNNTINANDLKALNAKTFPRHTIIFPKIGAAIATNKKRILTKDSVVDNNVMGIIPNEAIINFYYLYSILKSVDLSIWASESQPPSMRKTTVEEFGIPLPPLSVQQEIVTEIENYQKIIDGARMVVDNYRPQIKIDPEWEMVELGEVCEKITDGSHFSPETTDVGLPYVTVRDLENGKIDFTNCKKIDKKDYNLLLNNDCKPLKNDVLFSKDGTVGKTALIDFEKDFVVLSSLAIIRPNLKKVSSEFLYRIMSTDYFIDKAIENKTGVAIRRIVLKTLKTIQIPLPDLLTQKTIVKQLSNEGELINASEKIISLFEQKIKDRIAEVWGEKTGENARTEPYETDAIEPMMAAEG